VKNAPADGHTILFHIANFVQTPVVLKRWPYALDDFAYLGKFVSTPLPFCVGADCPATTLREFVAWAEGGRASRSNGDPWWDSQDTARAGGGCVTFLPSPVWDP
jgi:tripartite-type tricarboxylate transporter receptor subunit TctC